MSLKHRLVGASVVIAGMVIFLPALFDNERRESRPVSTEIELPPPPNYDFEEQTLPKPGQFDFRASEPEIKPPGPVDFEQPIDVPPEAFDNFSPPAEPVEVAPSPPPQRKVAPTPVAIPKPDLKPAPTPPAKQAKVPDPPPAARSSPSVPQSSPQIVGSVWVVQVGSFSRSVSAIELSDRLRKDGYSAFVERVGGPVEPSHRVKVGAEASREGAERLLRELSEREKLNGFVTKHP